MIAYLPLIVCIIGLFVYVLTNTNAKVMELGRIMFAFGLLAFLLTFHGFGLAVVRG